MDGRGRGEWWMERGRRLMERMGGGGGWGKMGGGEGEGDDG